MADGLFLSVLSIIRELGLLDDSLLSYWASMSFNRLWNTKIEIDSSNVAWGLGFSWKNTSSTEPFTITTCLVVQGLKDAIHLIDPNQNNLLEKSINWLRNPPEIMQLNLDGITVAAFSPHMRTIPWNVLAQWSCHLEDDDYRRPLLTSLICSRRFKSLGWAYDNLSKRIDLLHQGYIFSSLQGVIDDNVLSEWKLETFSAFLSSSGWLDKIDIVDESEAKLFRGRSLFSVHPYTDSKFLVTYPNPARLWSIGESLRNCSLVSHHSDQDIAFRRLCASLLDTSFSYLDDSKLSKYPRHMMHLLIGLATYLKSKSQ